MNQRLDVILIRIGALCVVLEFAVANILYFQAVNELKSMPFGGLFSALMPSWGSIMLNLALGGNLICTLLAAAGAICLVAGFAMRGRLPVGTGWQQGGGLSPAATVAAHRPGGGAPRLLCTQGEYANATIPLDAAGVIMGRDAGSCGLVLNSSEVSRMHAKVSFNPGVGQFLLQDLGSTNGVFVGATRVNGSATLLPGQSFRLGQNAATFTVLA